MTPLPESDEKKGQAMTKATDAQMRYIGTLITERAADPDTVADIRRRSGYLTRAQASGIIQHLQSQPKRSDGDAARHH